jgi:hypothetical protein
LERFDRDPYDTHIVGEDRWVAISIGRLATGTDWKHKEEAAAWAQDQFGDRFFRFGGRFYFADEMLLVQFKLRWL